VSPRQYVALRSIPLVLIFAGIAAGRASAAAFAALWITAGLVAVGEGYMVWRDVAGTRQALSRLYEKRGLTADRLRVGQVAGTLAVLGAGITAVGIGVAVGLRF
jgi:hypothetical protein